jgi:SCY1-like protein 1
VGLAATQQYYHMSEVASKVLPALCTLTCDSDKSVRDNAFKTIKGFLGKLEKLSEDPTLLQKFEADVDASTPSVVDSGTKTSTFFYVR